METIIEFFRVNNSGYLGYIFVGYVILFFFIAIKKIESLHSVWQNVGMFIFLVVFIVSTYFLIKYFGSVKLSDEEQGAVGIISLAYLALSYWVTRGEFND